MPPAVTVAHNSENKLRREAGTVSRNGAPLAMNVAFLRCRFAVGRLSRNRSLYRRRHPKGHRVARRPVVESLEQRMLLAWTISADSLVPTNILFEEDPTSDSDDVLVLSLDTDGNLQYDLSGSQDMFEVGVEGETGDGGPFPLPLSEINSIRVNASGGSDRLILDSVNGIPIPVSGMEFHGGGSEGDSDTLEITRFSASAVDAVYAGIQSGTIRLDNGPPVSFSQAESLRLGSPANGLWIHLPATDEANESVILGNFTLMDGFSALGGAIPVSTVFANPSTSLTIDSVEPGLGGGYAIAVEGLDALFDADLTIDGGNRDTVNFRTRGTDLGPSNRNLTVSAAAIHVDQRLAVTGTVHLDAAGDVVTGTAGNIMATGSVAITAGNDVLLDADAASISDDVSLTAGGDVTQNAGITTNGAGSVSVTSGGNIVMSAAAGTVSEDGRIAYRAAGDLDMAVVRTRAGGSIDVSAGGKVTVLSTARADAGGSLSVAAVGSVVFESNGRLLTAGGQLDVSAGAAITMPKGAIIDAGGGEVQMSARYGILLGRVVSPGATVTIDAGQGGIADGADPADPPDADGADIEANVARLRAAGSIGSRVDIAPIGTIVSRLETKINRLDAVSENGVGIFLVNEGPLIIDRAETHRTEPPLGIIDITTTDSSSAPRGALASVAADPFDVSGDGYTTALDALLVIDHLNRFGAQRVDGFASPSGGLDVSGDSVVSPLDALLIIDRLNRPTPVPSRPGEAEAAISLHSEGEFSPVFGEIVMLANDDSSRKDGIGHRDQSPPSELVALWTPIIWDTVPIARAWTPTNRGVRPSRVTPPRKPANIPVGPPPASVSKSSVDARM